jgi:hypothetical protein
MFSEDLNFDNIGLDKNTFTSLVRLVKKELELEGFSVKTRIVYKKAFHCYIKIPKILYKEGLSNLPAQKITIRINTMPQNYEYSPDIEYLKRKLDIKSIGELKVRLEDRSMAVNLENMAKDVEKFLFNASHVNRVVNFEKQIENL